MVYAWRRGQGASIQRSASSLRQTPTFVTRHWYRDGDDIKEKNSWAKNQNPVLQSSVGDLNPHVIEPPGGTDLNPDQAKIVRKTLIPTVVFVTSLWLFILENDVNVPLYLNPYFLSFAVLMSDNIGDRGGWGVEPVPTTTKKHGILSF